MGLVVPALIEVLFRSEPWVPHISLVFREMWDTAKLDLSPFERQLKVKS
jgi:hypothetical protein